MDSYRIIHEDADLLIANKLGPLPVQPDKSGDASLQDLLRAEIAGRAGAAGAFFLEAAHRIDRRASGAVIFAKTHRALETLEADFRQKRIEKTYMVCVEHEPEPREGRLEHRLVWDKRTNLVRAFPINASNSEAVSAGGTHGILEYRLAGASERYFFVEVTLITGKHHQIRAQLAAEGMPIRGDIKYGARRTNPNGLIMLHARRLVLTQPRTREKLDLVAPYPESEPLWAALDVSPSPP
jgi:23S rRNA pseudouridine1911/1915/1917 synthase